MKTATAERHDFIRYPTNRVVGTLSDTAKAGAAVDALLRAGFDRKDIDILHDEADLRRLDPTGEEHGFLAQFHRTLIRSLDLEEFKHLTHYVEDVRAGRYVIMVLTKRRMLRIVAADILHHYGAEFVGFYGRWACEELPPTAQREPQDIPALFVRAWNERNPDAIACLFDEDGEFVNATGNRWRNRASIRQAHDHGLPPNGDTSTLALDETTVRLLSTEIAVVHARMTRSTNGSATTAPHAGPPTTIASFVVHRYGQVWQCASAHTTDVLPNHATNLINESVPT